MASDASGAAAGGGLENSRLYYKWARRIKGENANDLVVLLTPHSSTSGSGSGKTTLAVQMAKCFDGSPAGFDAETNATLDANELVNDVLPNSAQRSALLWDEAQGTPGAAGLDARRGMTDSSIQAINAVLASRDQRHTLIIVAQQIGMLDSRLYPLLDAWVCIVHDPFQAAGPTAVHYEFFTDDYDLKDPNYQTVGIEEFSWDPLPADDPQYRAMEKMKQAAKTDDEAGMMDPGTASRRQKAAAALRAVKPWRDDEGMSYRDAGKVVDMSQTWVGNRVDEWKEGNWRDLVEAPPAYQDEHSETGAEDDEDGDSE